MRNKKSAIVLTVLLCIALIFSVTGNIVLLQKQNAMIILDYSDVNLSALTASQITQMYIDDMSHPELHSDFYNIQFAEDLCSVLENACYQRALKPSFSGNPGAGVYSYVKLTTDEAVFTLGVCGDKLKISIDGEEQWYYTNAHTRIKQLIDNEIKSIFPDS